MVSIQAGENPRVIEEKLKSFLTPQASGSLGEGDEGEGDCLTVATQLAEAAN